MADIKEKVEMELKELEKMCDEVQAQFCDMIKSKEVTDYNMVLATAKTLGVLSDIEKDKVEKMYKIQIMEAMEESDYGEDYDEEGPVMRKGYRGQRRDSKGRYMYTMTPEMYSNMAPEYLRDMDRKSGHMYYTGNSNSPASLQGGSNMGSESTRNYNDGYSRGYSDGMMQGGNRGYNSEGRIEQMKRNYTDSKTMSGDSQEDRIKNAKKLEDFFKVIDESIMQLTQHGKPLSSEEKTVANTYMDKWKNKFLK